MAFPTSVEDLRELVMAWIAEWFVGGILEGGQYVLGWLLFAADRVASILLNAAGPLSLPVEILADAIVGLLESIYGLAHGVATTAGLAGPPAAAFAFVMVSTFLAILAYALLSVVPGSDALSAATERFK